LSRRGVDGLRRLTSTALVACLFVGCGSSTGTTGSSPTRSGASPVVTSTQGVTQNCPIDSRSRLEASNPEWTAGGMSWYAADSFPLAGRILEVPHGFVALCAPNNEEGVLISSSDGKTWTWPADPQVVVVPSGVSFRPSTIAQRPDGYLALDVGEQIGPRPRPSLLWRSSDGVSWAPSTPDLFSQMALSELVGTPTAYLVAAARTRSSSLEWYWSSDGTTWTTADLPFSALSVVTVPESGLLVGEGSEETAVWVSSDGKQWRREVLPSGYAALSLGTLVSLPDGTAIGVAARPGGPPGLVRRRNGWESVSTPFTNDMQDFTSNIQDVAVFGKALLVASGSAGNPGPVWSSADDGQTWSKVADSAGTGPRGLDFAVGHGLVLLLNGADNAGVVAVGSR
jgi:hypothetical protein